MRGLGVAGRLRLRPQNKKFLAKGKTVLRVNAHFKSVVRRNKHGQ